MIAISCWDKKPNDCSECPICNEKEGFCSILFYEGLESNDDYENCPLTEI